MLRTALTTRLGLRYPIVAAPLGRGSTPEFLAALAREGALGFVALVQMPQTEVLKSSRDTLPTRVAARGLA
jgi:nitronate monooxygenase